MFSFTAPCYVPVFIWCPTWINMTRADAEWEYPSQSRPTLHVTYWTARPREHSIPSSTSHHRFSYALDVDFWLIYYPFDFTIASLKFKETHMAV